VTTVGCPVGAGAAGDVAGTVVVPGLVFGTTLTLGSPVVRGATTFVVPAPAVADLPGMVLVALLVASERSNSIRFEDN